MNTNNHLHSRWNIPLETLFESLHTDPYKGLTDSQVYKNRALYGENSITKNKPKSLIALMLDSMREPMMLLLLTVAALSFAFGKIGEAITMICVVAAYIAVEIINKFRSDRIMVKLRSLTTPTTKIIRDGIVADIPTKDIVAGDIIVLSEGTVVPADARLLTLHGLTVNEASLTGESLPVKKSITTPVSPNVQLSQRTNCVFSGTTVLQGDGTAIIIAVGQNSEFGKIAAQAQATHAEKTVLQTAMTKLAKILALFALIISALIPTIGYFRGLAFEEMVLTWLSLTFLMIPGQPPIIITMALALAAFALTKKQIIVKRLRGAEVMGQVTAIVSDKTGTITENSMTLEYFVTVESATNELPASIQKQIALTLPDYCTDPTDTAVFNALQSTKKELTQTNFNGFSDQHPWRDLIYTDKETYVHALTGSVELLVAASTLSVHQKNNLTDIAQKQAHAGKRVTAYAYTENKEQYLEELKDLTFIAMAVISDPIRHGIKEAIALSKKAGVATYIVTGDHQATAQTIATSIGITSTVITGDKINTLTDQELTALLSQSHIFARMDPSQKVRLVTTLQRKGEIVAVIGDGINDAPALKAAHVGIAMGHIGTDLAKEIADLILTDDNYIHIPDAIAIGRKALDNFRKGITYYLSAKCILLTIFLIPLMLGIPFPFAPIQIILIELLMDLASSTIFITEQEEPDIMEKPAQKISTFLGMPLLLRIIYNGTALAIGILFIYIHTYHHYDITTAQTAAFVTWLLGHICLALNLKQEKKPLIIQGILSNTFGLFWLGAMVALSGIVTMTPALYPYLKTTWLPLSLWLEVIIIACLTTFWIEAKKLKNNSYPNT